MTDYNSTRSGDVATSETSSLIAASKVEGTSVYNRQGEALGSVYDVMIDKRSGKVAYAVMSFGGFLGMGQSYHPLPWEVLDYDARQGGYVVDLDKERLQRAPNYGVNDTPDWSRDYNRQIRRLLWRSAAQFVTKLIRQREPRVVRTLPPASPGATNVHSASSR